MPRPITLATRALARVAIGSLVGQGLGSNAIINSLISRGLSYRRATMLEDIREFTGLHKLENTVRRLPIDIIFPQHAMVEGAMRRVRRYRVYLKAIFTDTDTGKTQTRSFSFYTDDRDSKEGFVNQFLDEMKKNYKSDFIDFATLSVTSVQHNRGQTY